jgi:hypothetical protein
VQRIGRLDAVAFGWAAEDDVRARWAHATGCRACGSLLTRDDEIHRRLALLRDDEPRIDVLKQVMQQIEEHG